MPTPPIPPGQPSWKPAPREMEFLSPSLRDQDLGRWINCLFDRLVESADRLGIEEMVAHVMQRLASPAPRRVVRSPYSTPLMKVRARIDDDPSAPITLAELAASSGMSRYQFVRAFSRAFGATPYAYVIQRRLLLARVLLEKGSTLAATAQLAGFADQSHMTRAFARQFGISPGRYLSTGA